jgi:hypothetical protein
VVKRKVQTMGLAALASAEAPVRGGPPLRDPPFLARAVRKPNPGTGVFKV